ncbi:MAG: TraB/GumN family protein [Spirochaetia bacterium]
MIRYKSTFLLLCIILFITLTAPVVAQQGGQEGNPPLWVVRNADTTVYLFGTIHLMTPNVSWYNGLVRQAFESADILYLEMNQLEISQEEQQQVVQETAFLPEDEELSEILPDSVWNTLRSFLTPVGVPEEALQRWKPWFAGITATAITAQQAGFLPQYGVDIRLARTASASEMEIRSLESLEYQFQLFNSLTREQSIYMLQDTLDMRDEIQGFFEDLRDAWLERDLQTLKELLLDAEDEAPGFYEEVFVQRNIRWADEIETILETEEAVVFLAVGSGHLLGDDSVVALLEERGYEVTLE